MTLPRIGADAELNLTAWSRSISTMLADAGRADDALDQIVNNLNDVESGLGFGGDVNLALAVDTSDLRSAVDLQQMLQENTAFVASADEGDIQAAVGLQAELDENTAFVADVSDSAIKDAVDLQADLEENTAFKADVDDTEIDQAKRKRGDLEENTSLKANVDDTEIDSAKRKRGDLEENASMKVNVDDGEIQSALDNIKKLEVVNIAINVAQPAVDFIKSVGSLSVGSLFEMDTAMAQLEGTVGRSIPGAEHLIHDLYVNGWGESRTEISKVIGLAEQLGISQTDMASAVEGAFQVSQLMGSDLNETLRTMDKLVKLELVPDYDAAADVIVAGFQEGGDRAGDLLETLDEYGSTFKDLGLDAEQATNILINAMDHGFKNTDLAADALREFNIRVRDLNDPAAQGAIARLGLNDAAKAFRDGTMAGDEFLGLVITKLNEMKDPAQRQITAVEIFGTQLEDIGTSALKGLDPTIDKMGDVKDRADDASAVFNNTLPTAIEGLKRFVEEEIAGFLDEAFDIEGAIDTAKENIAQFFSEVQSGTGLFAAMELSFNLPGLENTMQGIQRTFADIGIGMLQIVSEIMSILHKDTESIDKTIADLSAVQLRADIFASDSEENVVDAIERALGRGVDKAAIGDLIAGQVQAMVDSGDLTGAIALMDMLDTQFSPDELDFSSISSALQSEIDTAFAEAFNANDSERVVELMPFVTFSAQSLELINSKLQGVLEDPIRRFNESGMVVDYARMLSVSTGEINWETLRANVGDRAADEIVDGLWTSMSAAINAKDWDAAFDYASLLGRDEIGTTMDDIIGQLARLTAVDISTTAGRIMDSIGGIFDRVDETETNVSEDGDSITDTFGEVADSADETEKGVGGSTGRMGKSVHADAGSIERSGRDMSKSFDDVARDSGTATSQVSGDFSQLSGSLDMQSTQMRVALQRLITDINLLQKSVASSFGAVGKSASEMSSAAASSFGAVGKSASEMSSAAASSFGAVGKSASEMSSAISGASSGLSSSLKSIQSAFAGMGGINTQFTGDMAAIRDAMKTTTSSINEFAGAASGKLGEVGGAGQSLSDALTNQSNNGIAALGNLRDQGNAALDTLRVEYTNFVNEWGTETNRLIGLVNAANAAIGGLQPAPSGTGGSTGGTGGGFTGEPTAALTDAVMVGGASSVSNNSQTTINVNYVFNTNGPAQDVASMAMSSRALRGYN